MSIEQIISGDGLFTEPLILDQHTNAGIFFSVRIRGVFSGTLTLQISFDQGATFDTTEDQFTGPTSKMSVQIAEKDTQVRVGFETGDYISGDAEIRLGQIVID